MTYDYWIILFVIWELHVRAQLLSIEYHVISSSIGIAKVSKMYKGHFLFIHWVHSLKTSILKASGKPQVICKLAVEDFTSETMICLRRVQEFQKTFPQKYLGFLGRFEHRYNRSTESQYWILDEWAFRFFTHVICFVNLLSFSPIDGRILSLLIINEAYLIYFKRWMKFQVNRYFLKFGATFSIWIWLMLR